MILHILAQSPFQGPALQQCSALCQDSDRLLLIEDGIYALTNVESLPECAGIYALAADLQARGVKAPTGVEVVDYTGFVRLTSASEKSLSWY